MNWQRLHRAAAGLVFGYALVLYGLTVSPTAALWDTGEFIASAHGLEVMHPPGAPFYMLLGRLFSMFVPAGAVGLAVNLVSVLAAALAVLFAYLIVVRLVRACQRPSGERVGERAGEPSAPQQGVALGSGVVGALVLASSDTFWFNAVEAEVYALATCFTAAVVWLGLRWDEEAGAERAAGGARYAGASSRYLVLVAYLFGLSVGIHLMSVLAYFFVALLVFFRLFDRPDWTLRQRAVRLGAAGVVAAAGFAVVYPGVVIALPELADASGAPVLAVLGVVGLVGAGLVYTHRRQRPMAHLALSCLAALLVGYSSYALIPIRSLSDPPIDLNDPETAAGLVPYLKREQYGSTPLLKGPNYDPRTGTYDPSNVVAFPRRHSFDPRHETLYAAYRSDADYFWRYQVGHMYARYFLWNFAGRASDEQHAGWAIGVEDPAQAPHVYATPSERAGRNVYFGLPLVLGLLGLAFHARRDGRRALALGALFVVTGLGLVVYLNEVPVTPRERDYIYVASFFAFCLWIGLGAAALLEAAIALARRLDGAAFRAAVPALAALVVLLAVPVRMAAENYDDHDRSGNYVARDYAYNLLMSVDRNAILFTGGDNDTYPLWYLQAIEGVRRDVRVVCLPLLQTGWYARQLRDQRAYDAAPLPIGLTDAQLDRLQPVGWTPRDVGLPVDPARLARQAELEVSVRDTSGFDSPMTWRLEGRPYDDRIRYLTGADQVILDVLVRNARQGWARPVYFATTAGSDNMLDLAPYLQREGLALRVVPIRHDEPGGRIVPEIMQERLARFRFTGLADPDVYFADDARMLAGLNYRSTYADAADTLLEDGQPEAARRLMATILDEVPPDTIPLPPPLALRMAHTLLRLADDARATELVRHAEPRVLHHLRTATGRADLERAARLAQAVQYTYVEAGAYDEAAAFTDHLAEALGDESLRRSADEFRRMR